MFFSLLGSEGMTDLKRSLLKLFQFTSKPVEERREDGQMEDESFPAQAAHPLLVWSYTNPVWCYSFICMRDGYFITWFPEFL